MPQLRESQRSLLRSACLIRVPECRRVGVGGEGVTGVKEEDTIFNEVSWVARGKELTAPVWDLTHDCTCNWGPSVVAPCSASRRTIYRKSSTWGTEKAGTGDEQSHHGSGQHQAAEVAALTTVIKGVVVSSIQPTSCSISRQTST